MNWFEIVELNNLDYALTELNEEFEDDEEIEDERQTDIQ